MLIRPRTWRPQTLDTKEIQRNAILSKKSLKTRKIDTFLSNRTRLFRTAESGPLELNLHTQTRPRANDELKRPITSWG